MQNVTIAGQTFTVEQVAARFNDAQANPAVHGSSLSSEVANILKKVY